MSKRVGGQSKRQGTRPTIPPPVQRKVVFECDHTCSIPKCRVTVGLEIHHINCKRYDNREENLLVLCTKHHRMVHAPRSKLDRATCEQLKRTIAQLNVPLVPDRQAMQQTWAKLRTGRGRKKQQLFESLAEDLLTSVSGFIVVEKRDNKLIDEALVLIRNETADPALSKLGEHVAVE